MSKTERVGIYAFSLAVVGLAQFHLDWIDLVRIGATGYLGALKQVLTAGPLFFFAVPVSVTTYFEVRYRKRMWQHLHVRLVAYACVLPCLAMFVECFRVRYGAVAPDAFFYFVQSGSAVLAITIAISIKALAISDDNRGQP